MPHQPRKFFKLISLLLSFCFIFEQTGFAQVAPSLDISGKLASLHRSLATDIYRPLHLRYLQYLPSDNSFKLLLDKGTFNPSIKDLEDTSKDLLKYFFIGLTLPNDTFWVNLRPDSPDNIIDDQLAQTDIGRILLEADLGLKKDTARATSPETPEGRVYWNKLYEKAGELFGNGNLTIPTLTRPWIVPDEVIIRETSDSAYVYKATLKVMLEQDYLKNDATYKFDDERFKQLNDYSSQLIRELIIPKLTKEINTSKKYAGLRQVYYSLILAQWFKSRFKSQNTKYSQLIDRHNLTNLTTSQPYSKDTYFQAYQKSFKDGEYKIDEPVQTPFGQTVRSYFSGGFQAGELVPQNPGTSAPTLGGGSTMRMAAQDNRTLINNPYLAAAEGRITLGELVVKLSDTQLSKEEVEERVRAIEAAHQVEPERQLGEQNSDGTYQKYTGEDTDEKAYTPGGIFKKARILRDGGFTQKQRANLIKYGLAGNADKSIVKELAADPQKLDEIKTKYRELHKEIVAEVVRQHQQRGVADFTFTKDYSLGAQGAVKLKIFELLAKGFSERDIAGFITRDFLPALREEQMGALLPVGTEVEIWDKAPYTDSEFYPRSTVVEIWGNILGLPFGRDELVEFALPPSLSGSSQVAMIDSMVELGLIPQGWFSLHISGALPLKANHQHLLDQLASYLEMTKAILYTSDERIDYFADRWNPLDIKGNENGQKNVTKPAGKKPSFAIYEDTDEVTRLEYRSGDVVVPGSAYQGAIPFIQNTHSLMFLALVAAIDSGSIKNKFMEDLLVAFDTFISDIDAWAELIKDTHPQLKALFGGNLFSNVRAIKDIIQLRKASPELIEALGAIVLSLQERLRVILANAQRTQDLPADTQRIDDLEIIKRLRRTIPKAQDLKSIFMTLPINYLSYGGRDNNTPSGGSGNNTPFGGSGNNTPSVNGRDNNDDIRRWLNDARNFYNFTPINLEPYSIKPAASQYTRFEIPQMNLQLSHFQINQEDMIIIPRQPRGLLARLWGKVQEVLIAAHNWLIPFLAPLFPGMDLFPGLFNMKDIQTEFQKKFWDALKDNERIRRQDNFDIDSQIGRRALVNQALRDILSGLSADKVESLRQDFWKAADLIMRLPRSVSQKQAFNFALNIINWKIQNPPAPAGQGSPSVSPADLGNEDHAAEGGVSREDVENIAELADALGLQGQPLPQGVRERLEGVFGPGGVGEAIIVVVPQAQMLTRDNRPINGPVRLGNRIFVGDQYLSQHGNDLGAIIAKLGHEAMAQWIAERRPDLNQDAHSLALELEQIIAVGEGHVPAAAESVQGRQEEAGAMRRFIDATRIKNIYRDEDPDIITSIEAYGYDFLDIASDLLFYLNTTNNFELAYKKLLESYPEIGHPSVLEGLRRVVVFKGSARTNPQAKEFTMALGRLKCIREVELAQRTNQLNQTIIGNENPDTIANLKPFYDFASGTNPVVCFFNLSKHRKYVFVDNDPFAIAYLNQAKEMLGVGDRVEVLEQDIFGLNLEPNGIGTLRLKNVGTYVDTPNIPDAWYEQLGRWLVPGGQIIIEFRPNRVAGEKNNPIILKLREKLGVGKDGGWDFKWGHFEKENFIENESGSEVPGLYSMNTVIILTKPYQSALPVSLSENEKQEPLIGSKAISEDRKAPGGIDFRSLPIVTQAVKNLRAPIGAVSMGALQRINLGEEWSQIEQMVSGGITPSSERIREFVQASCVQGSVEWDIEKVISCISDILRQEEESCCLTDTALRDILIVLEATPSKIELSDIFLGKV